jgi:hypothetical protein
MYDRLNGLKSQAQVPPLSLSMVRTPLGAELDVPVDEELPPQAAASSPAVARTATVIRCLGLIVVALH